MPCFCYFWMFWKKPGWKTQLVQLGGSSVANSRPNFHTSWQTLGCSSSIWVEHKSGSLSGVLFRRVPCKCVENTNCQATLKEHTRRSSLKARLSQNPYVLASFRFAGKLRPRLVTVLLRLLPTATRITAASGLLLPSPRPTYTYAHLSTTVAFLFVRPSFLACLRPV